MKWTESYQKAEGGCRWLFSKRWRFTHEFTTGLIKKKFALWENPYLQVWEIHWSHCRCVYAVLASCWVISSGYSSVIGKLDVCHLAVKYTGHVADVSSVHVMKVYFWAPVHEIMSYWFTTFCYGGPQLQNKTKQNNKRESTITFHKTPQQKRETYSVSTTWFCIQTAVQGSGRMIFLIPAGKANRK